MPPVNLKQLIRTDPSLVWYTKNHAHLSNASILEHILNYGTWQQVQTAIKTLGLSKTAKLYRSLANKPRSNIKPRVKHYFDLYFSYASSNSN